MKSWPEMTVWLEQAPPCDKRELFVLVLFILKHSNSDMLRSWMQQQQQKVIATMLDMFCHCIVLFEYSIENKRQTKSLFTSEVALFMTEVGTDEMKELLKGQQSKVRGAAEELERLVCIDYE
jgi:hypothetical protein